MLGFACAGTAQIASMGGYDRFRNGRVREVIMGERLKWLGIDFSGNHAMWTPGGGPV